MRPYLAGSLLGRLGGLVYVDLVKVKGAFYPHLGAFPFYRGLSISLSRVWCWLNDKKIRTTAELLYQIKLLVVSFSKRRRHLLAGAGQPNQ